MSLIRSTLLLQCIQLVVMFFCCTCCGMYKNELGPNNCLARQRLGVAMGNHNRSISARACCGNVLLASKLPASDYQSCPPKDLRVLQNVQKARKEIGPRMAAAAIVTGVGASVGLGALVVLATSSPALATTVAFLGVVLSNGLIFIR